MSVWYLVVPNYRHCFDGLTSWFDRDDIVVAKVTKFPTVDTTLELDSIQKVQLKEDLD